MVMTATVGHNTKGLIPREGAVGDGVPKCANNSKLPRMKLMMPPMPNTPKPDTNISRAMSAKPTRIRAAPPQLTGRFPRLMKASTRKTTPVRPGMTRPGLQISTTRPSPPRVRRIKDMLGSARMKSTRLIRPMSSRSTLDVPGREGARLIADGYSPAVQLQEEVVEVFGYEIHHVEVDGFFG